MIANRWKPVVLSLALLAGFASSAAAESRWRHGHGDRHHSNRIELRGEILSGRHRYHYVENRRWDRQGDGRRNRPAEIRRANGYAAGSIVRRQQIGGYYGGSIEAYPVRGNGVYSLGDNEYWPASPAPRAYLAPRAKIIDVVGDMRARPLSGRNACSYEHGVCVIRGGR
jgi:hypothetical protein